METVIDVPIEAFNCNRLNREYHERLLANLTLFTHIANIQPKYIWSSLKDYCKSNDLEWVKTIKLQDTTGMYYSGKCHQPVEDVMSAIAGAMLRNYIDARMMTLQEVINHLKDNDMPAPTVLLIPNFYLSANNGGKVATWEVSDLLGMLLQRMSQNLKTIIYINDVKGMEKEYGSTFADHITKHYEAVI